MKIKLSHFTAAVGLLVMLAIHPSHAAAGQAADQLKKTVDTVLNILNDSSLKGEAKKSRTATEASGGHLCSLRLPGHG